MQTTITRTATMEWQPLIEDGVDTHGLWLKKLRTDDEGRPPTFLLRFEPGASYPEHDHPAGEEAFVLRGGIRFGSIELAAGDYLYTPPGQTHAAISEAGCEVLFVVPAEVEILP
jgi:quercetin dioxygenase-like cupin family protein